MSSENVNTIEQTHIYTAVTQKIITDLEKGELTWRKPWNSKSKVNRPLRYNDISYTGINTILLWATAAEREYISSYWMTSCQAEELKGHVPESEKYNGTQVVYAEKIIKEIENENGETQKQHTSLLKVYDVFNANQIEGLPEKYYNLQAKKVPAKTKIKKVEQFFSNTNAEIFTGAKPAYYPVTDKIEMPPFENFVDAIRYYGTLSHEVTHWTKHPSRLNRDFNSKRFADDGYALEELVAELGACFLAADLGFEPVVKEEHSAYIQSWLKALKHDKRFIFQAASHAQKAVEYMSRLQQVKKQPQTCLVMNPA